MESSTSITYTEELPGLATLWAETVGDPQICIAVLDGPVDQSHPSLRAANLTVLETLAAAVPDPGPASQHGTHNASVLFGQHDGPIKGIAPACKGLIVPIFQDRPDGSLAPCSQLDLARAIGQAVEAGAHIVNISGGELSPTGLAHPLLADVIRNCARSNVLIVAAAGNEGCDCLHIPGALPSVLAVGAMNAQGLPLGYSNWGSAYQAQGVLAPGENILGATPGGGIGVRSGTSFATPIVSGVAGLLLSLQRKLGRQPDAQAVRTAILESAYACDPQAFWNCRPFLVGALNISGAHRLIAQGRQADPARPGAGALPVGGQQNSTPQVQPGKPAKLQPGDAAPDFQVADPTGRSVRLRDYRGKFVVLWFYPQADTPG
jgi:cyanobactin maturation PatA/PatG family protease